MNNEKRFRAALTEIYEDAEGVNCTCEARSWYGDEHDTACPITIAGEALGIADANGGRVCASKNVSNTSRRECLKTGRMIPDYDPTPYETGEPDNLPREAQERAAESRRMKR